jgi:hypothetical protein
MVIRFVHRLLLVLIAFAFVGGTTMKLAQAAQDVGPMTMACASGEMMMPSSNSEHEKPAIPCKGMTPDCVKQMGCVTDIALPAQLASDVVVWQSHRIDYWSTWSALAGVVRVPEPLPPRTI